MSHFESFQEKMESAGLGQSAIGAFERGVDLLIKGEKGFLSEESIEPSEGVAHYESVTLSLIHI